MIAKEKLNILWSLEQTAEKYADRVAVSDVNQELTWKELVKKAQVIGAELSEKGSTGEPGSGSFREKFRNTGSDARHRLCRMLLCAGEPDEPGGTSAKDYGEAGAGSDHF